MEISFEFVVYDIKLDMLSTCTLTTDDAVAERGFPSNLFDIRASFPFKAI